MKVCRLLAWEGTEIPYATLHRYSVAQLGFGKAAPTIAVLEGEPGQELQVDTGRVGWLRGEAGKRQQKAWIFTATRSHHRFVYPTLTATTADAIEACEAALRFYRGVFRVLLPDNTRAIVEKA
jgi:transposase